MNSTLHDVSKVINATVTGEFPDLVWALLGSIAPGVTRRAALLGGWAVPYIPILSVPLAGRHAHLFPSISPAILHRFGA